LTGRKAYYKMNGACYVWSLGRWWECIKCASTRNDNSVGAGGSEHVPVRDIQ
jgi:hypothetical protein